MKILKTIFSLITSRGLVYTGIQQRKNFILEINTMKIVRIL